MDSRLDEVAGLRLGLVMNPTARIGERHVLDLLLETEARVAALFAPEDGVRGEAGAGDEREVGVDQEAGRPVDRLYGEHRKPARPGAAESAGLTRARKQQDLGSGPGG